MAHDISNSKGDEAKIKGYSQLADAARYISNLVEAYDYYIKVIELDAQNYQALFGIGNSIFRHSKKNNPVFEMQRRIIESG